MSHVVLKQQLREDGSLMQSVALSEMQDHSNIKVLPL